MPSAFVAWRLLWTHCQFRRGGTRGQKQQWNEIIGFHGFDLVVFVVFLGDRNGGAAERGIGVVNGLQDVEIKLFSAWDADVKTVLLNRIENLLG